MAHLYARFGYPSAQFVVGQRYLKGNFFVPLVLILLGSGRGWGWGMELAGWISVSVGL